MTIYPAGHFNVSIETSGTGPYFARGFVHPQKSKEPLRQVFGEGATESEAIAAARQEAGAAASELWLDPRYRHHID
ncbi:hypothetical protein [Stenotrophomonas maltophilia]|uniref:hypothetical protein n=1 Tax=Stenotrophomonas maltophilia TaxID=40324 RepID=UPI0021C8182C|nr:hypothetical protein [Stenotrophomonas maltophilia]MCU1021448.1 hypothetical protein [Stenotrophomonas maltophilia]